MVAIKRFDPVWSPCKDYRCPEFACVRHCLYVLGNFVPGRYGIPAEKCLARRGVVVDEKINILSGHNVERVLDGENPPIPDKLRYGKQRARVKNSIPVVDFISYFYRRTTELSCKNSW